MGAPVTDAGGNVARTSVGEIDAGAQPAADGAHEVEEARVRLDVAQSPARRSIPNSHTRPEIVAGEVDDHHVLGAVLRARRERSGVGGGALDRPRLDPPGTVVVPLDPQEQLGRRRDDREVGASPNAQTLAYGAGLSQVERVEQVERVGCGSNATAGASG